VHYFELQNKMNDHIQFHIHTRPAPRSAASSAPDAACGYVPPGMPPYGWNPPPLRGKTGAPERRQDTRRVGSRKTGPQHPASLFRSGRNRLPERFPIKAAQGRIRNNGDCAAGTIPPPLHPGTMTDISAEPFASFVSSMFVCV